MIIGVYTHLVPFTSFPQSLTYSLVQFIQVPTLCFLPLSFISCQNTTSQSVIVRKEFERTGMLSEQYLRSRMSGEVWII